MTPLSEHHFVEPPEMQPGERRARLPGAAATRTGSDVQSVVKEYST
jgi:hypothetical protein